MGLLDQFGNLNEEQTQGLLAAAAQMLQQSGPSARPTGLGQILGGGMGAYQDSTLAARKRKLQEAEAQQMAQVRGLQIRDSESDFQNQEAARAQAGRLRDFYMKQGAGAPQAQAQGAAPGAMSQMPGAPQPQGQPAGGGQSGIYQQRLGMAERLRAEGFSQEADAQEAAALKFQPKVKNWQEVQHNGQILYAPFFEDGTNGQPVPLEVARKLEKVDSGQSNDMIDPYTGKVKASIGKKQTLESLASTASAAAGRAQSDRHHRDNFGLAGQRVAIDRQEAATKAAFGKAPTEFQGKSSAYGLRAREADKVLSSLGDKYSPAAINAKNAVGSTWLIGGALEAATNKFALNESDQMAEQAQRDFINATLRQESGAAIPDPEFANGKKQYFPQPGDGAAVIAQKARNRQLVIQGFDSNAGRAVMTAPPKPAGGQWSIKRKD